MTKDANLLCRILPEKAKRYNKVQGTGNEDAK